MKSKIINTVSLLLDTIFIGLYAGNLVLLFRGYELDNITIGASFIIAILSFGELFVKDFKKYLNKEEK